MNITLSADPDLIKKGRAYAKTNNISLNQLVRNYLLKVTGECEAHKAADEFVHLANTQPGCSNSEFIFSRDSIYNRHLD